jgi:hypothetical protein
MSDFSLTLVLLKKNKATENHQRHGKITNKIRETHTFRRYFSNHGAI